VDVVGKLLLLVAFRTGTHVAHSNNSNYKQSIKCG
jgi:hypothetical protein